MPEAATAWLHRTGRPFNGTEPGLPHDDLAFLPDLVGDARVVALGENTHGTRDFFEMKARILRYLVEELGFDAFAIEASWPEAGRIDAHVRSGGGDGAALLAGLYFWTWNTQSVLDMIGWMRAQNAAGGDIGFYGFDMQYPGMAIHLIETFVGDVDAGSLSEFQHRLDCMAQVANDPSGDFLGSYEALPAQTRDACRADLTWVHDRLSEQRDTYIAAGGEAAFERAMQSARVILQYEAVKSGLQTRDASMAENVEWLLDRLGPDARIVLWAHNYHVSDRSGAMGHALRGVLGDDLVTVAFSHASGTFTAASSSGLGRFQLDQAREDSYEAYFHSTGIARFFLDLRPEYPPSDSTSWLQGPRSFRSIGCCVEVGRTDYWTTTNLRADFDIVIHVDQTSATELLDSRPPGTW